MKFLFVFVILYYVLQTTQYMRRSAMDRQMSAIEIIFYFNKKRKWKWSPNRNWISISSMGGSGLRSDGADPSPIALQYNNVHAPQHELRLLMLCVQWFLPNETKKKWRRRRRRGQMRTMTQGDAIISRILFLSFSFSLHISFILSRHFFIHFWFYLCIFFPRFCNGTTVAAAAVAAVCRWWPTVHSIFSHNNLCVHVLMVCRCRTLHLIVIVAQPNEMWT